MDSVSDPNNPYEHKQIRPTMPRSTDTLRGCGQFLIVTAWFTAVASLVLALIVANMDDTLGEPIPVVWAFAVGIGGVIQAFVVGTLGLLAVEYAYDHRPSPGASIVANHR